MNCSLERLHKITQFNVFSYCFNIAKELIEQWGKSPIKHYKKEMKLQTCGPVFIHMHPSLWMSTSLVLSIMVLFPMLKILDDSIL